MLGRAAGGRPRCVLVARADDRVDRLPLLRRERPRLARAQRAQPDRPELRADEMLDLEAQRLAQPAHLAVPPLGDRDEELPPALSQRLRVDRDRNDEPVVELDATA